MKHFLPLIFLLTGCTSPISGTVKYKTFTPAHTVREEIMISDVLVPYNRPIPDTWILVIDRGGEVLEEKEVSKEIYDAVKVGDHVGGVNQ